MKDQTTLILRYPDKNIPEDYLRRVLKDANAGGYAVQSVDNGQPVLITDRQDVTTSLEDVKQLLESYASSHVLLTFSQLEKVDDTTMQPFELSVGESDTLLAFGIEGEFPSMKEAGITEAANFSKKVILPNLGKFLKYSDGDLQKFLAELKDPTFVDSLLARVGERGVFCFLPPTGSAFWLGKDKLGSSFPWGQVSRTFDYTENPAKPVKEEAPVTAKKTGWFTKEKGPALPVAQDPPLTKPAEAPIPGPLNLPAGEPDTRIVAPPADPNAPPAELPPPPAGSWEKIPDNMSKQDRKNFIRRVTNCGKDLPKNWDSPDFLYWKVEYPAQAKTLPELKDQLIADQNRPKDMRDANGPRPAPSKGSEVVSEANSLVLTAEEKTQAEETILKIMDRQGKEIPSPLDIQKLEAKYPKFSGNFGIKLEETDSWLPVDIEAFARKHGKQFFHLFLETRREKIALAEKIATMKPGDVEVNVTGQKPVASGQPPITEPLKKAAGGWGWNK